jgi:hypothetical protein
MAPGRRRDLSTLKNLSRAPSLSIAQKVADPKRPRSAEEPPPTGFNASTGSPTSSSRTNR